METYRRIVLDDRQIDQRNHPIGWRLTDLASRIAAIARRAVLAAVARRQVALLVRLVDINRGD